MAKNAEGMLWVKLIHRKTPLQKSSENDILIPIRWTRKHRNFPSDRFDDTMGSMHVDTNEHDHHKAHLDGDVQKNTYNPMNDTLSAHPADVWRGEQQANHPILLESNSSPPPCARTDEDEDNLCVVCMERASDFQLLPCRHDRFCQQCMIQNICTWVRPLPPSCPLCRAPFHTMVLLD
jgi:hypothetical protein